MLRIKRDSQTQTPRRTFFPRRDRRGDGIGSSGWGKRCALLVLGAVAAIGLQAQTVTFNTLFSFDGTNGAGPEAGLVQATNGNFYGTTYGGGAYNGNGTAFGITPSGTPTFLYSFCEQEQGTCPDGATPVGGLIQATNGELYGTTSEGGVYGDGTIFKITLRGKLTTIYSFKGTDGASPQAALIQATDGDLYGTTIGGGAYRGGTVFKINLSGKKLTTLYSFCKQTNCTDGAQPYAGLIQATDGNFYGTTLSGGLNATPSCNGGSGGCGTVFKITPHGHLTTMHRFCSDASCADGASPYGGLVQATNGYLYGTTWWNGLGGGAGTIFQIATAAPYALTPWYQFCSQPECADGGDPYAGLIQATDGNLYGTTQSGGAGYAYGGLNNGGTIFSIDTAVPGSFSLLHTFCSQANCVDGDNPVDALVQATNGVLYGTTDTGQPSSAAPPRSAVARSSACPWAWARLCSHRLPPARWERPSPSWATI